MVTTLTTFVSVGTAMSSKLRASAPALASVEPYDPKSLPADVFISANESPYNMPEVVRERIAQRVAAMSFNRYPDPLANALRDLIAERYGVKRGNVLCGNGGDELLFDLMLSWGGPGRTLLNFPPTFGIYELNAQLTNTAVVNIPREGDDFHINIDAACQRLSCGDIDICILTSPNNPTGCCTTLADIERILDASDALVLVDEAYIEFAPEKSAHCLLAEHENLLILHTFSKAFSGAGVRLGYVVGSESIITEFLKVRQAYSVDSLSQIVGEEVLRGADAFEPQIAAIRDARGPLMEALAQLPGVTVHPSDANFILISLNGAQQVWERLFEEHSVLVRNVGSGRLRITVGSSEENEKLLAALSAILN